MKDPSATRPRIPESDYEEPPRWAGVQSFWLAPALPAGGSDADWARGLAGYLSAFQFGPIRTISDPFFGQGSKIILRPSYAKVLPIQEAALGALNYLLDDVTGVVGGRGRWRTMPRIVLFGLAVGAALVVLAFVSGTTTKRFGDGWAALLPWPKRGQESPQLGGE